MNQQAQDLNEGIAAENPIAYRLLSSKGRSAFFPKAGILAQAADAKGRGINATIGIALDDDGLPMRLDSLIRPVGLPPGDVLPYAPSFGVKELREAWLAEIQRKNPSLAGKTTLPIVTSGITHGLNLMGHLFVDEGEPIILPDKFWGNYRLIFEEGHRVKLDTFPMFFGSGFNVPGLRGKLMGDGTKKVVLLNFPNNPTGYTPTDGEVREIVQTIRKSAEAGKEVLVVCDDAYFGLVYKEGVHKESVFAHLADLHPNVLAVKLDGATKEDYAWGLRVGFMTYATQGITSGTSSALEAKTAGAVRGGISNAPRLSQSLLLHALESDSYEAEKRARYETLRRRFELVEKTLEDRKYAKFFSALPFNSGYFMCVQLNPGLDAERVRQTLLAKYDSGVIATGNFLRVAFSSVHTDSITQLFENIYEACKEQN